MDKEYIKNITVSASSMPMKCKLSGEVEVTSTLWYSWKSKHNFQNLVLSFYHVSSRDGAQALSLDSNHPYLLSHLCSSKPDININTTHQYFSFAQSPLDTSLCMFCEMLFSSKSEVILHSTFNPIVHFELIIR